MKFPRFPELSTLRLRLRNVAEEDVNEIYFLRSDALVNQYVQRPTPQNTQDALAFIHKLQDQFSKGESIYWVLCLKSDLIMIGSICLWNFSKDRRTAELGYDLHTDHHSQGLMSEAFEQVLRFGFEVLHLEKIEAYTQKNNVASVKLLERHGFQLNPERSDEDNPLNIILELSAEDGKRIIQKE